MQVIDFDKKGNVIRLYFGDDNEKDYWGDDWGDRPYENASPVYDEFIIGTADFAFPYDMDVLEPSDDWFYNGNPPYGKEDFKQRKAPCLVIVKDVDDWEPDYHTYAPADAINVLKIFFEDDSETIAEKILAFGGVELV